MGSLYKHLARLEVPGGGQVFVSGKHAFLGHLRPPHGTTIVDVADPRRPRVVGAVDLAMSAFRRPQSTGQASTTARHAPASWGP